jgi:D-alanyl-D-alanine carboxypeptidase
MGHEPTNHGIQNTNRSSQVKRSLIPLLFLSSVAAAETIDPIQSIINHHLSHYSKLEHFSAIQVSIKAGDKIVNYTAGYRSLEPTSLPITATDLFDIGSITKSFTSSLALLAESEGKLKLSKTLGEYLNNYPNWGDITLSGLLDMSTGIPNYSNSPTLNYHFSKNLRQFWKEPELISLVYPKLNNPPRLPGYFYSNTGYILMDMILTAQYKMPFHQLLADKIIKPMGLNNTYYPIPTYPENVLARMVRGYSYNIYDNPELLGKDVTENNMTWAGAAGALVANSEDVVHWVDELFVKDRLLTTAQKQSMQTLISVKTGKPITQTSQDDPRGFALGISQGFDDKIGHYWFYEGKTLGYRALYMYVPCNKVIVVALFNSATNHENDHAGALMQSLYFEMVKENKSLECTPPM